MKYNEFEAIISPDRMRRYVSACGGNVSKAMALYRYNLAVSSELFKIISCFEVALRNQIDKTLKPLLGNDWLRDCSLPGGIFDNAKTIGTLKIIRKAYNLLKLSGCYTPTKLMAEMEFGIWKYMYSGPEYAATGQKLLSVFPAKPKSTAVLQIDNKHIFNELNCVNQIRNRIAHHEPICFAAGLPIKTVYYIQREYQRILKLLSWMGIEAEGLLYGIDHVRKITQKIINL